MALDGKIALVTDASRGISAAVAKTLAAQGVLGLLQAGFVSGATLPVNGGGYVF